MTGPSGSAGPLGSESVCSESDEAGLAWFREAWACSSPESFAREDMGAVVAALNLRKGFYGFVVQRFFEVAASGFEFEMTTGVKVTISDQPTDAWNQWRVARSWEYGMLTVADAPEWIPMERCLVGEHGAAPFYGAAPVKFPLDVLFGEREQGERDERYEQYLALKAEFEPGA